MRQFSAVGRVRLVSSVLLLGWWAVQAHAYVPVWRSNEMLTQHVWAQAPEKPRALLNYGVMLAAAGRLDDGEHLMRAAAAASYEAHVPRFEREVTKEAVDANLAAVAALRARR